MGFEKAHFVLGRIEDLSELFKYLFVSLDGFAWLRQEEARKAVIAPWLQKITEAGRNAELGVSIDRASPECYFWNYKITMLAVNALKPTTCLMDFRTHYRRNLFAWL